MRIYFTIFLLLLAVNSLHAQETVAAEEKGAKAGQAAVEKKSMEAAPLSGRPKIDGRGDDPEWASLPFSYAGKFTQISPNNLQPSRHTTEIKLGYTDYGLYVLAQLNDPNPAAVARELGLRDDFERVADRFGITIDTYKQGQNAFYFAVTSAGVQLDLYITPDNEDVSWDAVWNSAVQLNESGWMVEMEIPWSAIRFAKREEQVWGLNFMRVIRNLNEESFWSPVDASQNGFVNQSGTLSGINNINPPLRLQLFPYVSAVAGHDWGSRSSSTNFGGGMDVKWGINESFTLDMALIPDFSQVQSDNQVLNLSPFEIQFAENRPFFTEGTELFNKKNLFYSRRVGHVFYTFQPDLPETSSIISRPTAAKLINATKISGRTHKGLGVGFFNAITSAAFLEVRDTIRSGPQEYRLEKRELMVDPVTNFNVLVVDQNLPNNSNVSLINTNVSRASGGRDANVSALDFRLRNKKNMYQLEGFGAMNMIWDNEDPASGQRKRNEGFRYSLTFGKISGQWQYMLTQNVESKHYDVNDMGIIQAPNEISHYGWLGYRIFEPVWIFNRVGLNFNLGYERLYKPNTFANLESNVNGWVQFKNFWSVNMGHWRSPIETYDFFEPRQEGYTFARPHAQYSWIGFGSDGRKRLATSMEVYTYKNEWDTRDWGFYMDPRYRISNRVSVNTGMNFSQITKERGWVDKGEDGAGNKYPIFGGRSVQTLEPSMRLNVTFNNKMGFNMRLRYYWRRVRYNGDFYQLQPDGGLRVLAYEGDSNDDGVMDKDVNFNSFNIDLFWRWQVAPGSFLTFGWKDASQDWRQDFSPRFSENYRTFVKRPHNQTFSLKFTYFLDYLMVRNWTQGRN